MAITADYGNKLILADSSITDIVAFHDELRNIEQSDAGMLNPTVHTWKALDLGAGSFMYGLDFINGWEIKFPNPGSYTMIGNINANIVPVAGVFVDRSKAAAFATVAGSGGGSDVNAIKEAILTDARFVSLLTTPKFMALK